MILKGDKTPDGLVVIAKRAGDPLEQARQRHAASLEAFEKSVSDFWRDAGGRPEEAIDFEKALRAPAADRGGTAPPIPSVATVNAELSRLFGEERRISGLRESVDTIWARVFGALVDPLTRIRPNDYDQSDWRRLRWGDLFSLAEQAAADPRMRKSAAAVTKAEEQATATTETFEGLLWAIRKRHPEWGLLRARDALLRTSHGREAWAKQRDASLALNEDAGQ